MDVLRDLPNDCIDLIYLDPPFNSNQFYVAAFGDKGVVAQQLKDVWRWTDESERAFQRIPHGNLLDCLQGIRLQAGENSQMAAYCVYMGRRLAELHRVLKPTGSIYLHCDPHANHYLRLLMDAIWGRQYFRNEIIWAYRGGGVPRNDFARKHDVIFRYSKTGKVVFNVDDVRIPYSEDSEERLRYKARAFRSSGTYDTYEQNPKGKHPEDWWELQPIMPSSKERLGYPTQKPLALLERIIKASSNKGDIVLDPFCGCGTAADAAAKLGRGYLGIDISALAVRVMEQRLASRGRGATPIVHNMSWDDYEWEQFEKRALLKRDDAEDGVPGWAWAEDRIAGLLNAVPNQRKVGDGGVDARYFTERGEVIPIQVKMHQNQIGRPDMQRLLGVVAEWQTKKVKAPMSLMVTLYPPSDGLRVFATQQGQITIRGQRYPKMQVLSVQEMLTKKEYPKLPPVDPRYFVGDTQTRFAMAQ